jgi:hypothetical protein
MSKKKSSKKTKLTPTVIEPKSLTITDTEFAETMHKQYMEFVKAGFTTDQAFQLTHTVVNNYTLGVPITIS